MFIMYKREKEMHDCAGEVKKMQLKSKHWERCLELYLQGELDHHGAQEIVWQMEREIERALPLQLVLDWKGVSFMDSSGIAVVMRARQRLRELGGTVTLRHVTQQPRKVLEAAGIGRYVHMEEERSKSE